MKLDTKVYTSLKVGAGARLSLLATEGHGCFIRVEAGQLRGDGVHVFVLEDQYQIIKKICLLKNGMLISHLAIFEM